MTVALHDWVKVDELNGMHSTYRMVVPGGWLYRFQSGNGVSIVFVPKPRVNFDGSPQ